MKTRLPDRIKHLEELSGFTVRYYKQDGTNYFVFVNAGVDVKTYCTYPKAKAFAQGVAIGRVLNV
jgi:hypothetical protein